MAKKIISKYVMTGWVKFHAVRANCNLYKPVLPGLFELPDCGDAPTH